ncbi:MAG TPA: sensor histidine kinase [Candidatus Krumholzibacteria bacterium]|nr:sensor histidine kinase [Candidatus Krumholzibacteria bacterium]
MNISFRHAIPVALLLLLVPVLGIQAWLHMDSADERVGVQMAEKGRAMGAPTTVAIESSIRRGAIDGARRNLVSCRADPDLERALVVDQNGVVLTADDLALEGAPLDSVLDGDLVPVVRRAMETLTTQHARDRARAELLVALPLRMHDPDGSFFSRRTAAVVLDFDTSRTREAVRRTAAIQFAVSAAGHVAAIGLLWAWLNHALLSRVRLVVDRLRRLRRGDLRARIALRGVDEISVIGRAIDGMANSLQTKTTRLEDTEDHLRDALREQLDLVEEVRLLSRRLSRSAEHERQRIARDLHDDLGQDITAFRYLLESLRAEMGPSASENERAILTQLARTSVHMTDKVRSMLSVLRPAVLHEFGVGPALESLGDQTARITDATLEFRGDAGRLDPDIEIELYRIAQEATLNAAKHSGAHNISASFRLRGDRYELVVSDDGRGFGTDASPARSRHENWGLIGIRERARAIGAELQIESDPESGTTLRVVGPRQPIRKASASGDEPVIPQDA